METALPQLKLTQISKELNPEIERIETEDEKIAQLHNQVGWEALKERLERKKQMIESSTKVSFDTMGLIDDMQLYGFKCAARDLLLEAYQSMIDDVELTYKYLKEKKDEQATEQPGAGE